MKKLILAIALVIPASADPLECTLDRVAHASDVVAVHVVKPLKKAACKVATFAVWLYRGLD